jgi:hypothetical protein
MQNRCDKYSVMLSGFAALSSLWIWPIPLLAKVSTLEKVAGLSTFGFGLGAVIHLLTKNGPGYLDPIHLWGD